LTILSQCSLVGVSAGWCNSEVQRETQSYQEHRICFSHTDKSSAGCAVDLTVRTFRVSPDPTVIFSFKGSMMRTSNHGLSWMQNKRCGSLWIDIVGAIPLGIIIIFRHSLADRSHKHSFVEQCRHRSTIVGMKCNCHGHMTLRKASDSFYW